MYPAKDNDYHMEAIKPKQILYLYFIFIDDQLILIKYHF